MMQEITKSRKLDHVAYDVRGPVVDAAAEMEAAGEKILKLNIGNPAPFGFRAPEQVVAAMEEKLRASQGYSDSRGVEAARAAIAAYHRGKGLTGVTLKDIPVNRYTVTETAHPDLANYYCTTTADDAAAEVQVMSGQTAEVTITNSYAPFLTLTITKQVTGGLGDARREFPFTATVAGQAITAASAYVTKGEGAALTGSGFTLRHRGSITIGHLRPGDAFTVTETDNTGYETSFDLDGSVEVGTSGGGTLGAQSATLTCVNNKDGAPPTGFGPDTAPAVWMLLCALLGLVCLRRRKGA